MNLLDNLKLFANTIGEKVAIKGEKECVTYKELDEYSERLACWIHKKKGKEPIVVYGHKSPYMIVCFLACVKAGRAYCPQDISIPHSRVEDVIESVNSDIIFQVENQIKNESYDITDISEIKRIINSEPNNYNSDWQVAPEDVYYIIFTSGSTGKPKGVQITYDCLNNYLDWSVSLGYNRVNSSSEIFLNQAPFSFDLSVMDLYTCLAVGGTLITLTKDVQNDYSLLFETLEKSNASTWVSTPSFANICLADKRFSEKLLPNLKAFLFCGEVLTTATTEKLLDRFMDAKVINTYGPTESTVAVSQVNVTKDLLEKTINEQKSLPVGEAKKGTYLEIWNENNEPVAEGKQGEIIIIGDTVSIGYYMRDDLTKKSFFKCIRDGKEYRGYHTGDAGYIVDNQLYYIGRIDLQIKLHGYRIEIEDIENNILRLEEIEGAVVVPKFKDGMVKSLTAFVTGDKGDLKDIEYSKKIKEKLGDYLPKYMIPKKIKHLDSIPMNNHGKIDRKYLGGLL